MDARPRSFALKLCVLLALAGCAGPGSKGPATGGKGAQLDRTVLPIAEPPVASITEVDARKATPPPRFEVKAPEGAPNVVIVLIDDIGFGPLERLRRADQHADAAIGWRARASATTGSTPPRSARRRGPRC